MRSDEWQPIETAPKDGTPILGRVDEDITTVEWYEGYWTLCVAGAFAEDGEWTPTHWMPLPTKSPKEVG